MSDKHLRFVQNKVDKQGATVAFHNILRECVDYAQRSQTVTNAENVPRQSGENDWNAVFRHIVAHPDTNVNDKVVDKYGEDKWEKTPLTLVINSQSADLLKVAFLLCRSRHSFQILLESGRLNPMLTIGYHVCMLTGNIRNTVVPPIHRAILLCTAAYQDQLPKVSRTQFWCIMKFLIFPPPPHAGSGKI